MPTLDEERARELADTVREIRERIRSRHPSGATDGVHVPLANLMPLLHARDAAEAKVAAIGSVNPRRGGVINRVIQVVKKTIARSLTWFVRDQVQFNTQVMAATQATLEALNEMNVAFQATASHLTALKRDIQEQKDHIASHHDSLPARLEALRSELLPEIIELRDIRTHWYQWRQGWEHKLHQNEVHFLRSVAELQAAYQHRVTLLEGTQQEAARQQHANFEAALVRSHEAFQHSLTKANEELQDRFWKDLAAVRSEYEQIIHSELRVVRQRLSLDRPAPVSAPPAAAASLPLDYYRFAERFRGTEDYVRRGQELYRPTFRGLHNVLDIGCGRGEFLEMMREENVSARGIDLSEESVAICRAKGLQAEVADLFVYLPDLPDAALGGIFCSQVIEHLAPERLPEFIKLASAKLRTGGILAIETPNPESLAIFATHFYLDPTHTRPVPIALLRFYYEEFGLGSIEEHRMAPAVESMPELNDLPEAVRNRFFGALDYSLVARKL